jgi:hypothetical protein
MKKFLQLIVIAFFCLNADRTFSQVLNGDFSNWAPDSIGRIDLVGWETTNALYGQAGVLQDTDRTSINGYSVQMIAVYDSSVNDYGTVDMILNNAPFSNPVRPVTLSGFWKFYNPNFNDLVIIEVNLYDSANNQIGTKNINTPFTGSILNWTPFSMTINYSSNASVNNYSITIIMVNSTHNGTLNCNIDDLTFDVSTSVIDNLPYLNTKLLSLDKSHYRILISQEKPLSTNVEIYDLIGNKVMSVNGNHEIRQGVDLDLSQLQSGVYYGVVANGVNKKTFKIPH